MDITSLLHPSLKRYAKDYERIEQKTKLANAKKKTALRTSFFKKIVQHKPPEEYLNPAPAVFDDVRVYKIPKSYYDLTDPMLMREKLLKKLAATAKKRMSSARSDYACFYYLNNIRLVATKLTKDMDLNYPEAIHCDYVAKLVWFDVTVRTVPYYDDNENMICDDELNITNQLGETTYGISFLSEAVDLALESFVPRED